MLMSTPFIEWVIVRYYQNQVEGYIYTLPRGPYKVYSKHFS